MTSSIHKALFLYKILKCNLPFMQMEIGSPDWGKNHQTIGRIILVTQVLILKKEIVWREKIVLTKKTEFYYNDIFIYHISFTVNKLEEIIRADMIKILLRFGKMADLYLTSKTLPRIRSKYYKYRNLTHF